MIFSDICVEGIHLDIYLNGKAASCHQTSVFLQPPVEDNQSDIQDILFDTDITGKAARRHHQTSVFVHPR